jgi:hypothetical protein
MGRGEELLKVGRSRRQTLVHGLRGSSRASKLLPHFESSKIVQNIQRYAFTLLRKEEYLYCLMHHHELSSRLTKTGDLRWQRLVRPPLSLR